MMKPLKNPQTSQALFPLALMATRSISHRAQKLSPFALITGCLRSLRITSNSRFTILYAGMSNYSRELIQYL